jgi:hypothetical protein
VNDGAKSAQLGALAFTAIGLFLLATAFSATDEDLLLNRALTISQLGGTASAGMPAAGRWQAFDLELQWRIPIRGI